MARETFKTIEGIIDFLEGTGYKIGIMGHDFISCAVPDRRCNKGWRVEFVINIRIKSAVKLIELFRQYKIDENAILEE